MSPCIVPLQRAQGGGNLGGRRGNVGGVLHAGSGRTDPVLYAAELAGVALRPSNPLHEDGMHLPQQPLGDGQLPQAPDGVLQRPHVVADFLNVVPLLRLAEERGLGLECVEIDQGGTGTLDPGGEHRLPPEEGSGEQVRVRQGAAEPGQLAENSIRFG